MEPADETGAEKPEDEASTLGFSHAIDIVCAAANTDPRNLSRTLGDLGVDGVSFQGTVFNGIREAGYLIDIDSIPDAPTSTLFSVAGEIQNAKLA